MFTKSRSLLLAASLIAAPMAVAMAQSTNSTESKGTHSDSTRPYGKRNIHKEGATGTGTVVPGSTSTLHGASAGKSQQKKGTIGRQ